MSAKSRLNILWYNRNINQRQANKYYCSRERKPQNKLTFTQNFSWSLGNWCGTVKSYIIWTFKYEIYETKKRGWCGKKRHGRFCISFISFFIHYMIDMNGPKKNGFCIILYERKRVTWNCFSQLKIVVFQIEMKQTYRGDKLWLVIWIRDDQNIAKSLTQ